MTEKKFETQIKRFLKENGVYPAGTPKQNISTNINGWYFKVFGGGFQKAGIPDLIANINGSFVSIEVKGKSGKPSKLQELNTELIKQGNGIGLIVYPKDFNKLKKIVRGLIDEV